MGHLREMNEMMPGNNSTGVQLQILKKKGVLLETTVNESLTFQWDTKADALIGEKRSDAARSDPCAKKATTSLDDKKQDFRYKYFYL